VSLGAATTAAWWIQPRARSASVRNAGVTSVWRRRTVPVTGAPWFGRGSGGFGEDCRTGTDLGTPAAREADLGRGAGGRGDLEPERAAADRPPHLDAAARR